MGLTGRDSCDRVTETLSIFNRTSVDEPCKRDHRRTFAGASASAQESIVQDQYADLEKPIEDVGNMAAIVTQVMQQEAGLEAGDVTIRARSCETFYFAVYHLQELANGLHADYFRARADASL